jgi:ribosome-associated toxin RatA of RatAB toxin-antitoxin module
MRGFICFARRAALVMVVLVAAPGASVAADSALPGKGEIELKTYPVAGSTIPRIVLRTVMDLPPKKIWQIVSDCAHYKEHLPSIASSELVKRSGNVDTCKVTYSMPFPFSNLTGVTESVNEVSESLMVRRWKHVSGDYRVNDGSWEVKALDAAGTSSLVTYTIHVDPTVSVPDFIRDRAQKKTLPEILQRIRAEAAKLP